ncbi:hypothetical protein [Achromobacter aloeverae]|uniref:Outer membrane protein assembly factor BamE n=1 Tax=Achromobacter aloeverae TaxID=1750518 RepID=A0A4Q1HR58_9BURK|nr:hypothetical protein [Achromobacter aloeverae]RXN92555.1 hypothetical protein C7R54_02015 [Achromobacter aloeverae]
MAATRLLRIMRALACAGTVAGAMALAGCSFTTGRYYTDERVASLVPGQSTMMEATRAFNAPPTQQYPQSDGTTLARWDYKFSLVPDAIYARKSTVLQFGADGRLIRLVDSDNVILPGDSRQKLLGVYVPADPPPADVPVPAAQAPAEEPASMPIVIPGNGPVTTPVSDGKAATPH